MEEEEACITEKLAPSILDICLSNKITTPCFIKDSQSCLPDDQHSMLVIHQTYLSQHWTLVGFEQPLGLTLISAVLQQ